jgi:hypothetical protein
MGKKILLNTNVIFYNNGTPKEVFTCKDMYWDFVKKKRRDPTSCEKWAKEYPEFKNADQELWPNIFKLSFSITRETKLQSFQYRIIHRIITCRKRLFDIKIADSPKCQFCNNEDNITHFFLFCPIAHNFWNTFFTWWNGLGDIKIQTEYECLDKCILFGFPPRGEIFEVLNFCILNAKYYIHNKKLLDENNIEFLQFLYILKFKLKIEHDICEKNNTPQRFDKFIFMYEQL